MRKVITLETIIEMVLEENGISKEKSEAYGAAAVALRRDFERLVKKLGSDKKMLKQGDRLFRFDEEEIPFMKTILLQLYYKKGIIFKFVKQNKEFSSNETRDFIISLIDEAEKEGFCEEELIRMGMFFSGVFKDGLLRIVEDCHQLLDGIVVALQGMPIDTKVVYLKSLEHILKKEFALQFAKSRWEIGELAEVIKVAKDLSDEAVGIQDCYSEDPEIRQMFIQRDREMLEVIQEDDDFREYIEKSLGKKVEDIFDYAILDN